MAGWTAAGIPDLSGRTALVTGANSGLGFETALQLAKHGARVLMAARDSERCRLAYDRLTAAEPDARLQMISLDLADLTSVRSAAAEVATDCDQLDILVNNAGVMATPYQRTVDGFESQLATNHLGHFALTGLVLPLLLAAPAARVVTVSSLAHRQAAGIRFDDLQGEKSYTPMRAYAQSKLANLMFAAELDRRARAAGSQLVSAAAHPGLAATNLMQSRPGDVQNRLKGLVSNLGFKVMGQSVAHGAWPQLYAATMPDVLGGEFFGPRAFGEWRGSPARVGRSPWARDEPSAQWFWDISEELTGVTFDLPVPAG